MGSTTCCLYDTTIDCRYEYHTCIATAQVVLVLDLVLALWSSVDYPYSSRITLYFDIPKFPPHLPSKERDNNVRETASTPAIPRQTALPEPTPADLTEPCVARLTKELAQQSGRVPPEARADLAITQVHLTRRSVPDEDPEQTLLLWLAKRGFHDVLALKADVGFEVRARNWNGR